jgi:hypothetical protein
MTIDTDTTGGIASGWSTGGGDAASTQQALEDQQILLGHGIEPSPITESNLSELPDLKSVMEYGDDTVAVMEAARRVRVVGFQQVRFDYSLEGVLGEDTFPAPTDFGGLYDLFQDRIVPQQPYFAYHEMPFRSAQVDGTTLVVFFSLGDG